MLPIAFTILVFGVVPVIAEQTEEVVAKFSPGFSRRAAILRESAAITIPDADKLRLAQEYLVQGQSFGHAASVNVAKSLVDPFLEKREIPASALLTAAGILSYRHEFSGAYALLEQASIRAETRDEALLQMVSLNVTRGDYSQARQVLAGNPALLGQMRGIALLALLGSLNGELSASYKLLSTQFDLQGAKSKEEEAYIRGVLAEMTERLGLASEAEAHYKKALATTGPNLYLANAYLAFLMDADRRTDALKFIEGSQLRRELTLWKAIASPAPKDVELLEDKFARSEAHDRELCLFLLRVKRDSGAALAVALRNWAVQKELIDTRLVFECAIAANQRDAAAKVKYWVRKHKQEDFRTKRYAEDGQ
jgi:hypothetical protein